MPLQIALNDIALSILSHLVYKSNLIHFDCIGVVPPSTIHTAGERPAAWTVKEEQLQCRQNGSNLIYSSLWQQSCTHSMWNFSLFSITVIPCECVCDRIAWVDGCEALCGIGYSWCSHRWSDPRWLFLQQLCFLIAAYLQRKFKERNDFDVFRRSSIFCISPRPSLQPPYSKA